MKLKSILAVFLALSLLLFAFPLSAFADDFAPSSLGYDIKYSSPYSSIDLSQVPFGTLQRVSVGNDIVECYQSHSEDSSYNRLIIEKYGLFTHLFEISKDVAIGAWTIRYTYNSSDRTYLISILLDGKVVDGAGSGFSSDSINAIRYGFSLVYINSKPYIWFMYLTQNAFAGKNVNGDYNYCLIKPSFSALNSSLPSSTDINGFLLDPTAGGNSFNTEVDIPGGTQTPVTVFFDSWTTCPNCGSHNVSYKTSFLYSGAMVLTGQVGWVFKCRDCGASWKGITSNQEELELFKKYMAEIEYSESLVEDSSLPPFTSTPSTVDLPTDVGGIGEYINQVFSALTSFTSSFNSFFSQVFAVLPAPVVGIILLGVGLVIIIGIIKAVRG